jgi:hypothetical protein
MPNIAVRNQVLKRCNALGYFWRPVARLWRWRLQASQPHRDARLHLRRDGPCQRMGVAIEHSSRQMASSLSVAVDSRIISEATSNVALSSTVK